MPDKPRPLKMLSWRWMRGYLVFVGGCLLVAPAFGLFVMVGVLVEKTADGVSWSDLARVVMTPEFWVQAGEAILPVLRAMAVLVAIFTVVAVSINLLGARYPRRLSRLDENTPDKT